MNARQRRTRRRELERTERAIATMGCFARRIAELWQEKNQHEERIEEIVFLVRK